MKNKNFELGILIRTHKDLIEHTVAENIILIDDIDYFFNILEQNNVVEAKYKNEYNKL